MRVGQRANVTYRAVLRREVSHVGARRGREAGGLGPDVMADEATAETIGGGVRIGAVDGCTGKKQHVAWFHVDAHFV